MNHKSCIEDIIIGNVLRLVQFRELRRACDCTGAKVRVSQRLKSLPGIVVRNCGFSETVFLVVCDDIWIVICPSFVVVYGPTPLFVLTCSCLQTHEITSLKILGCMNYFGLIVLQ